MSEQTLFLTLTEKNDGGGVGVYRHYLQTAIPTVQVVGKETLDRAHSPPIQWPFMQEVQHGRRLRVLVDSMNPPPKTIIASGMHAWAFPQEEDFKLVTVLHGTFSGLAENGYSRHDPIYWRMRHVFSHFEKKSACNARIRIANSLFTQREARKYYACDSQLIEPPINTDIFSPGSKKSEQKKIGWETEKKHVLFVGNPIHSKGFDTFLALASRHPEWVFHSVSIPTQTFLPNLFFHPPTTHEKLVRYYRSADLLIFPSRYEGFGFVPLEALASGCPIITSCVGIFHDFSHVNAHVVNHTVDGFDSALIHSVQNPSSIKKTNRWTERFSMKQFTRAWRGVIEE